MPSRPAFTPQRSAWLRTAPTGRPAQRLSGVLSTQVLVIGGGIAGLSAAIRTAELGRQAVVVESEDIGFGASGRSGGQLIPGLKHDPQTLVRLLGEGPGTRLARFAGDAPRATFELIRRYGIDCDAQSNGWLQPATDDANLRTVSERARAWSRFSGIDAAVLDAAQVKALTGSNAFTGGWIDPRGGQVQPLSYTRGLAKVAFSLGVPVFSGSAVESLARRAGRWRASVNGVEVTAEQVLICTNGYTTRLGTPYAQSFVPASSIICSTVPLPRPVLEVVLPSRLPVSDARRLLNYFCLDRDGRFLIGSRGSFGLHEPARGFEALKRSAVRIFPALAGVPWQDAWGGRFALTTDFLPHVFTPGENAWLLIGCNGRGMAMMSVAARAMAEVAATGDLDASPLPITALPRIPLHALRRPGLEVATWWYRMRDRLGV